MSTTPRDHLEWAALRALEYYDAGQTKNAVASFLSDVQKHEGTAWIALNPFALPLLRIGADGSREDFARAMRDFAV